jgi:hypothetical protein
MMRFMIIITAVLLTFIWGCGPKGKPIGQLNLCNFTQSIHDKAPHSKVVCLFKGNCSSCIAGFMQFNNDSKENISNNYPTFFIVSLKDSIPFLAQVRRFDLKVRGKIYFDSTFCTLKSNQKLLYNSFNVFLLDSANYILATRSPF